jgi:hypothetical protein
MSTRQSSALMSALAVAAIASSVATPVAHAGTLATAALFTGNGDDAVCMLSNVTAAPLTNVSVKMKDGSGGEVGATLSSTDCAPTLSAGESCFLNKTLAGAQRVRCEFTFQGTSARARGVFVLDDGVRVATLDAD